MIERGGAWVAENAVVVGDVTLRRGSSVWYGAVLRGDLASIRVGEATNIQDLCVLHCDPGLDLEIGPNVTIGHHAVVHSRRIGESSLIGIGAILLAGASIGAGCVIAAGAVVRENQEIPDRSIAVGVPARIVGRTDDEALRRSVVRALRYMELARRHAAGEFAGALGAAAPLKDPTGISSGGRPAFGRVRRGARRRRDRSSRS